MKIRALTLTATLVVASACGGGDQGSAGDEEPQRAAQALQQESSKEGATASVDPCGLLTAADLTPFFGDQTPIPESRVHIFDSQLCEWESDAGELSLIVWPGVMYYDKSEECPDCPAADIGKESFMRSEQLQVMIQVLLEGQVLQLEASYLDNGDDEFIALARAATERLR